MYNGHVRLRTLARCSGNLNTDLNFFYCESSMKRLLVNHV